MGAILDRYNGGQGTAYKSISYRDGEQPYVSVDINSLNTKLLRKIPFISDVLNAIGDFQPDGNNLLAYTTTRVGQAAIDVNRIGNFLVDPERGPLFIAQQQALQAMNSVPNLGNSSGNPFFLNTYQLYDPFSSVTQAGLQGIGGHKRRTVDPPLYNIVDNILENFNIELPEFAKVFGEDTYEGIYKNNKENSAIKSLFDRKYQTEDKNWYSYMGGPESFLGIGLTSIRRDYNTPEEQRIKNGENLISIPNLTGLNLDIGPSVVSTNFISEAPERIDGLKNPRVPFNILKPSTGGTGDAWSDDAGPIKYSNYLGDTVTVSKGNWKTVNRETRIGSGRQDSINLTPIFSSKDDNRDYVIINGSTYTIRDLAKFRIEAIDSDNPLGLSKWMVFRAYITRFQDDFSAELNPTKYSGKGETLFSYAGFNRNFSVSFKVAALSEAEMIPMWQKLNFLASNMAPDYAANGIMRGPFMRMTIGNYFYRQPCMLAGLNFSVPQDSPWEIALSEPERDNKDKPRVMYELPHIMEVNMNLIPIGVGRDAERPEKGESKPFVLYKPKEGTDPVASKIDNIWLSNLYTSGKNTKLVSQPSKIGNSNNAINGNK